MLKKILFLLGGVLLSTFSLQAQIAPKLTVVNNINSYVGSAEKVYSKADNKWYALNNMGHYEEYGVYEKVSTLKVSGGDATEIEYIATVESNGTDNVPYINTHYIPKANSRIVLDVDIDNSTSKDWMAVFGSRQGGWTSHAFVLFARAFGSQNGCYNRTGDEHRGDSEIPRNQRMTIDAFQKTCSFTIAGQSEPTLTITTNDNSNVEDCTNNLYLFDTNTGGANEERRDNSYVFMKLYGCKIYEGETLVRDFVPIVDGSGKGGLKDKLSGNVYTSASSNNFELSADGQAASSAAGITVYTGKLVQNTTDNHEYKWNGTEWEDLGLLSLEPVSNTDYKNLSRWQYFSNYEAIFANNTYDETSFTNHLEPYVGQNGWEPLWYNIENLEAGEIYNVSFRYSCGAWRSWSSYTSLPFYVFNKTTMEVGEYNPGASGALGYIALPQTQTTNREYSCDFATVSTNALLCIQFGVVDDGSHDPQYYFYFDNIQVSKYVLPVKYEALPELEDHVCFATQAEAEAYPNYYEGQYIYLGYESFDTYQITSSGYEKKTNRGELPWKGQVVESGKDYYLYQVDSNNYPWLQANNRKRSDWTTHGELGNDGFDFTITSLNDGTYQINPKFGHNKSVNYNNFYLDTGDPVSHWVLVPITKDGKTAYVIKCKTTVMSSSGEEYLVANQHTRELWQLVTKEERMALLENATETSPQDVSWLIQDGDLWNQNERRSAWTFENSEGNIDNGGDTNDDNSRGNRTWGGWNTRTISMTQVIENIPNGIYQLSCSGFYRDAHRNVEGYDRYVNGTDGKYGFFFANDVEKELKSIYSEAKDQTGEGFGFQMVNGKCVPDNLDQVARVFSFGHYKNDPLIVIVTDGKLTIGGRKKDHGSQNGDWVFWDKFRLTYLGSADVNVVISNVATDGTNNYGTLYYSDRNLVAPEGIGAYTATVADGEVTLTKIEGAIPAGTGVVLKTDSKLEQATTFNFAVSSTAGTAATDNMLNGTDVQTEISGEGFKYYMLSLNGQGEENSVGFYWGKNSVGGTKLVNGAHKAYLAVPASKALAKGYPFGGDATGIEGLNVNGDENAAEVYDLQGRKLQNKNLPKGIYIVNGKKVVKK